MILIECRTYFDITATGVTGHYKSAQVRFPKLDDWNQARNQQRNYETLTQILGLRTQIMSVTHPEKIKSHWIFRFESESNVWDNGSDPVGTLKSDCDGVPMIGGMGNTSNIKNVLITSGPDQNIWFELITINNALENTDG